MATRRDFLKLLGTATAAGMTGMALPVRADGAAGYTSQRPPLAKRKFVSQAVEQQLASVKAAIADPKLAWMFENCYPNTLDTTVELGTLDGKPDTFVITGDIDAMWLRDSSAQVVPYVPLAKHDLALQRLFRGLLRRQARCIRIDPYANAFMPDPHAPPLTWARHDLTDMKPGVGERKWEIDSLCYPIRLAHSYWQATGDREPFDDDWRNAMHRVVQTFREQQRKHDRGPYHFQRTSPVPTDTQMLDGYGNPTRPNGMIHSMFRPSDDACVYPLFVPANLFAVRSLRQLAQMSRGLHQDETFAVDCEALAAEVEQAVHKDGRMHDADGRDYWAYEIDGFGNWIFMDDANVPSLAGLALIEAAGRDDPLFRRTAALAWSDRNPYFFKGSAAEGIGGPHVGQDMIWPMSIITHAMNSDDDATIRQCLHWLKTTHSGTGFMHESFHKDDPSKFTRPWFAWANALFGQLIVDLAARKPALIASRI